MKILLVQVLLIHLLLVLQGLNINLLDAQYDGSNYSGMLMRFYLDGTEVTDARRTIYGYLHQ